RDPSNWLKDKKLNTIGICISKLFFRFSSSMLANTVNGAGSPLSSHKASAAAIFIGWDSTKYCACQCPVNIIAIEVNTPIIIDIRKDFLNISKSCFLIIFHALIPAITNEPVANDVNKTCGNCAHKWGLVKIAKKSFICALPSTNSYPTGFCMNEFADNIQNAESTVPIATSHTEDR